MQAEAGTDADGGLERRVKAENTCRPWQHRFAHGMMDWMSETRITARELAMLRVMDSITDKPEWHVKIFDQDSINAWRVEFARRERLVSPRAWAWCLDELRWKADQLRWTGHVVVYDAGVGVAKATVSSATTEGLKKEVAALMSGGGGVLPVGSRVSLGALWDHLGKGTTSVKAPHELKKILHVEEDEPMRVIETWPYYTPGALVPPVGFMQWRTTRPWRYSNKFQWLPCEAEFIQPTRENEGERGRIQVRITSYINDLSPGPHRELYRLVEEIASSAVAAWNDVLVHAVDPGLQPMGKLWTMGPGRTPLRILSFGLDTCLPVPASGYCWKNEGHFYVQLRAISNGWEDADPEERGAALAEVTARMRDAERIGPMGTALRFPYDYHEDMWEDLEPFMHPEPGTLFSFEEWKDGSKAGKYRGYKWSAEPRAELGRMPPCEEILGHRGMAGIQLQHDFKDTGLQLYVRIQSIELTPDEPRFDGTDWATEGMLNERIVATSIVFFDMDNLSGPATLSFRIPTDFDQAVDRLQRFPEDARKFASVFDITEDPDLEEVHHMQDLGSVSISTEGRMVSFPSPLHYRLGPVALGDDASRPGRLRYLTLCLCDPNEKVISTRDVTPQSFEWWLEDTRVRSRLGRRKLPTELVHDIIREARGEMMSEEEGAGYRAQIAGERASVMAELDRLLWRHNWTE
ncbi:unnamed protein product [Parascedosporium putredinis]|uniref:Uncharacterized protein n=1 Tax=Parascedosporium putredinis TaxID=1442378 RepID=A0A9P1MAU3_9PEZI|nr:unnamed protein product [Parascedosporium putredinis]CAI7994767.1 unnamed protein product [Parascedosporium putredinis]